MFESLLYVCLSVLSHFLFRQYLLNSCTFTTNHGEMVLLHGPGSHAKCLNDYFQGFEFYKKQGDCPVFSALLDLWQWNLVHDPKLECCVESLDCYLQGKGHIEKVQHAWIFVHSMSSKPVIIWWTIMADSGILAGLSAIQNIWVAVVLTRFKSLREWLCLCVSYPLNDRTSCYQTLVVSMSW